MTIQELFAKVDSRKPNNYEEEIKIDFVNTIEGLMCAEILMKDFVKHELPSGLSNELLVAEPYSEMYIFYIMAQLDIMDEEFDLYNNHMMLFNEWYSRFEKHIKRVGVR